MELIHFLSITLVLSVIKQYNFSFALLLLFANDEPNSSVSIAPLDKWSALVQLIV